MIQFNILRFLLGFEPTPITITKENFKADLELLATTIFEQASSSQLAPLVNFN